MSGNHVLILFVSLCINNPIGNYLIKRKYIVPHSSEADILKSGNTVLLGLWSEKHITEGVYNGANRCLESQKAEIETRFPNTCPQLPEEGISGFTVSPKCHLGD